MENINVRRFGWQFFKLNQLIDSGEALVKKDNSLKGLLFTLTLAFFILIGSAQFLVMVEESLTRPANVSASTIQEHSISEKIEKTKKEIKENIKNPLLVLNKILGVKIAQAKVSSYTAKKLIQSHGRIVLPAGKAVTFQVGFKNTGTATWFNDSRHYVSIYNRNKYTDSFRHKFWFGSEQPAKLQNSPVRPGEIGYFRFALQAPDIPGKYLAKFQLAAEDLAWISGSELKVPFISVAASINNAKSSEVNNTSSLPLAVLAKAAKKNQPAQIKNKTDCPKLQVATEGSTCGSEQMANDRFSAFKLIQSQASPLYMKMGDTVKFRVGFKNTGTATWTKNNIKLNTSPETKLEENEVKSGALGYFAFTLRTPSTSGNLHFELLDNNNQRIPGGDLDIFIQIKGTINSAADNSASKASINIKSKGPLIRVGLFSTEKPVIITANGSFTIQNKNGSVLKSMSAGQTIALNYQNGNYFYENKKTSSYLRVVPKNEQVILEILSLEQRPSWNLAINYNKFRGSLELRRGTRAGKVWMINELPLEDYLKGVAETSNYAPLAYLETMTVAARSYANYHYTYPAKHALDFFTVDDTYDQVYRGYNSERLMPNLVKAVDNTNGEIVTYKGEVVVTPYYSRSDGRTRAWTEVWGGSTKPWLVSVSTPYDAGKTLWGHGVGLAATDALARAKNGVDYKTILKHYYSNTEIKKIY